MRSQSRLPDALFFALIAGLGLGLSVSKTKELAEYSNVPRWEQTEGMITVSQYKAEASRMFFFFGPVVRNNQTAPRRVIRYEYMVDGKTLQSDRIAFGQMQCLSHLQKDYEGLLKKYPKGAQVVVHYDPANPTLAVLESSVKREGIIALGVGVFLLVLGTGSFLRLRKPKEFEEDYSYRYIAR